MFQEDIISLFLPRRHDVLDDLSFSSVCASRTRMKMLEHPLLGFVVLGFCRIPTQKALNAFVIDVTPPKDFFLSVLKSPFSSNSIKTPVEVS